MSYFVPGYIEEDYFEDDQMAIDLLPPAPQRGDSKEVFDGKADAWTAALVRFSAQCDAVAIAMSNNATNSTSVTSNTIGTGAKTFAVQTNKSYLPGQTVRAAATTSPTVWMQGDVTGYDTSSGLLSITMNATQGAGTFTSWTLSLSAPGTSGGSLTQDFDVRSLTHAIGPDIASASTIDLSAAAGNTVHVTGNSPISAVTMTTGKDVWVIFDGAPLLNYHATNNRLNSGGANITAVAGSMAFYSFDGTTVRATYFRPDGKANVETAPPAGLPVGSFLFHAGSTPPANYLTCPTVQTNLSRTTYSALFAAIGTAWGAGDGGTTFGMPWFWYNYTMLQANGNVGSNWEGDVKAHTHNFNVYPTTGAGSVPSAGTAAGSAVANATTSTGGTQNLAAGHRVLICVKYQ